MDTKEKTGVWCDECGKKVDTARLILKHDPKHPLGGTVLTVCILCLVNRNVEKKIENIKPDFTVSAIKIHKTGKKPTDVVIGAVQRTIKSWKEGYMEIIKHLTATAGAGDILKESFPKYVGKTKSAFRIPVESRDGLFVETHLSSASMQSLAAKFVSAVGQDVTKYRFVV